MGGMRLISSSICLDRPSLTELTQPQLIQTEDQTPHSTSVMLVSSLQSQWAAPVSNPVMEALKLWERSGFPGRNGLAIHHVSPALMADPHSRGIMRLCSPIFYKFLASLELLDLNLTQTHSLHTLSHM